MMLNGYGFVTNQNWRAGIFLGSFMGDKGCCLEGPEQGVQGAGLGF